MRLVAFALASLLTTFGCSRNKPPSSSANNNTSAPPAPKDVLVFPPELKVDDPALNDFVSTTMHTCAKGDYEEFRRLWSVREDPLTREEFNQGWQAVQEIRITALEKIRIDRSGGNENSNAAPKPTNELYYVVLANVQLDPTHLAGQHQPKREVLLLLIPEQGSWRIARAPKTIHDWLRQRNSTTPPPSGG